MEYPVPGPAESTGIGAFCRAVFFYLHLLLTESAIPISDSKKTTEVPP